MVSGLVKILSAHPIKFNYKMGLLNAIKDQNSLRDHIKKCHRGKDSKFILGMYGEFAVSAFMHTVFGYPTSIIPNKDLYFTDLKYKEIDPNLCNIHVKTIDLDKKHDIISGMCNIYPGDMLLSPNCTNEDVIVLCGYSMVGHVAEIYCTVPADIAYPMWTNPKMPSLIGKTKAIYYSSIVGHSDAIDLSKTFKEMWIPSSNFSGRLDDFFSL